MMKLSDIKKLVNQYKTYSKKGKIIEPPPTGNKFLDDRYEAMRNDAGYVHPYYRFFYALAKKYTPKVIVELGSWQGTSAAHFAGGSPESLVITVDHHSDPNDEENKAKTIEADLKFNNLHYCNGWTCNQLWEDERNKHYLEGGTAFPCVLKHLNDQTIDILFIDSWHRYDQAMKDWEAYKPLLSKGALVICDDIYGGPEKGKMEGMLGFWDQFDYPKFLDGQIHPGYPMGFMIV